MRNEIFHLIASFLGGGNQKRFPSGRNVCGHVCGHACGHACEHALRVCEWMCNTGIERLQEDWERMRGEKKKKKSQLKLI